MADIRNFLERKRPKFQRAFRATASAVKATYQGAVKPTFQKAAAHYHHSQRFNRAYKEAFDAERLRQARRVGVLQARRMAGDLNTRVEGFGSPTRRSQRRRRRRR